MARTGTSVYPATFDAFDRIGTANYEDESGYDHVNVHNEVMDGIENIEAVIGTTAGTSVLKNVLVGQFVATTAGTETLTNKTINNAVIGTSAISGGTASSITLTTPTINGIISGTPTFGAWTSYSPTWTNVTVGSGAVVAAYNQIGKTVFGRVKLTLGGNSTVSGDMVFSLPVTSVSVPSNNVIIGQNYAEDFESTGYVGFVRQASSTSAVPILYSGALYAATAPFTWGSADFFSCYFSYEAL